MYTIFKQRKLPCIPCLGETHIKLEWYNIFPSLFFPFFASAMQLYLLRLCHQTSATKLCYWRSSAFYKEINAQNLQQEQGRLQGLNNYYTLWTLHGWSYCRMLL